MAWPLFFITGTDTGVGKTVFAALLIRALRQRGLSAAALKPICSGGRDDARHLWEAGGKLLSLDEVNPWHFHAPLSPLLAARRERRRITLVQAVAHVRAVTKQFDVAVVEGAGGLLSPLGEGFDSLDLLMALRATPVVVCPNRLGAINQVLLVLAALPRAAAKRAHIVLMSPPRLDLAARANLELLAEFVENQRIHTFGWLGRNPFYPVTARQPSVRKTLDQILAREFSR